MPTFDLINLFLKNPEITGPIRPSLFVGIPPETCMNFPGLFAPNSNTNPRTCLTHSPPPSLPSIVDL